MKLAKQQTQSTLFLLVIGTLFSFSLSLQAKEKEQTKEHAHKHSEHKEHHSKHHGKDYHHTEYQKMHKDHKEAYMHKGMNQTHVSIDKAWVRAMPPAMKSSTAFLTITNNTDKTVSFNDAKSDSYGRVEFHQTVNKDDLVSMQKMDKLTLAPNQSLELNPQGVHLMLMEKNKDLNVGDQVRINLCSQELKTCVVFKAPVVQE